MGKKRFLATILLVMIFCFVSGVGYGEIPEWVHERKASYLDFYLLGALIDYMMFEKDSFLRVAYYYDSIGTRAEGFPAGVKTKGKIVISVADSRGFFAGKTGQYLLFEFEERFFSIKYFLSSLCSDFDNDVVAEFMTADGEPLGYFYQGEYYLWEE